MTRETIGPTFRRVILLLATAAIGGGTVAVASAQRADPAPETARRLAAVEAEVSATRNRMSALDAKVEGIDRRTERMDNKLDRLIERK